MAIAPAALLPRVRGRVPTSLLRVTVGAQASSGPALVCTVCESLGFVANSLRSPGKDRHHACPQCAHLCIDVLRCTHLQNLYSVRSDPGPISVTLPGDPADHQCPKPPGPVRTARPGPRRSNGKLDRARRTWRTQPLPGAATATLGGRTLDARDGPRSLHGSSSDLHAGERALGSVWSTAALVLRVGGLEELWEQGNGHDGSHERADTSDNLRVSKAKLGLLNFHAGLDRPESSAGHKGGSHGR